MTQGAVLAMAEMGVRPGRDVVIATHANKGTSIIAGGATGIIRIEFDPAQLVAQLLAMLETLMAGEIPATDIHRSDVNIQLVPPRLVSTPQQQRFARVA
jgi:hypothetical protein